MIRENLLIMKDDKYNLKNNLKHLAALFLNNLGSK